MPADPNWEERLRCNISDRLVEIESMFTRPVKVTCVVREPGNPEMEVVVTNDANVDEIIATLRRRTA